MYISVATWRDLSDGRLYHEGDTFPFDGRDINPKRTEELLTGTNRAGLVLIKEVEDPKAEEPEKPKEEKPAKPKTPRKTTKK